MALFIHLQNDYFYHIANLDHFTGVLDAAVAYLGNVDQTILVNTDIHEYTKVNDVSDGTGELHAGFQILQFQDILPQDGGGESITGIPSGFTQFFGNIDQFAGFLDQKYGSGSGAALYTTYCDYTVSVTYQLSVNTYRGTESLQFIMQNYC